MTESSLNLTVNCPIDIAHIIVKKGLQKYKWFLKETDLYEIQEYSAQAQPVFTKIKLVDCENHTQMEICSKVRFTIGPLYQKYTDNYLKAVADAIRFAGEEYETNQENVSSTPAMEDVLSQIETLGKLFKDGALTQVEFLEKKAVLLNKIK